jgi:uncharacterized repeat protein (TIGR03803 family)
LASGFAVIHSFQYPPDVEYPAGRLIRDPLTGAFYGNGYTGGNINLFEGGVFKISGNTESVLYRFCSHQGCSDGVHPIGNLAEDGSGNIYGTASSGGVNSGGVVFKITPAGMESVVYSFCSKSLCADGTLPAGGVIRDARGNLYGTTISGSPQSGGTVFSVALNGKEKVLYSFCAQQNCTDGDEPHAALIRDKAGNLYGTTEFGGGECYCGTVFKIAPNGKYTLLYTFQGGTDGSTPASALVADATGNLYGTTEFGGGTGCGSQGCGTVFKLATDGMETVLYRFSGSGSDGGWPISALYLDTSGNLYGTTQGWDPNNGGAVFEISSAGKETTLYEFCSQPSCSDGADPTAGLFAYANALYGTTANGGTDNVGVVFKLKK